MAYIGMRNPKFWPISTPRVDGSAIVYGNPVEIGPAVSANVTFETNDNPDYGNDVIIDNDKGINGYSIALETTGDETMGTRTWRIETAVFLKGSPNAPQNTDAFFDSWSAGHPDRSVRVIQWITFDKADVFIVLSRGR